MNDSYKHLKQNQYIFEKKKKNPSNNSSLLSFKDDVVNQEDLFSFRTQEGKSPGGRGKQKQSQNSL